MAKNDENAELTDKKKKKVEMSEKCKIYCEWKEIKRECQKKIDKSKP